MATVNIPVALATDLSKHATTPTTHKAVVLGQATTETSSSERIITQLTTEEKVELLSGTNFVNTAGVARLGIPPLKVSPNIQKPYDKISADNYALIASRYCEWSQRQRSPQWNFNTLLP